jgi:hypothetical protein
MGSPKRTTPTCEGASGRHPFDKTSFVPSPYSRNHKLTKGDGGPPPGEDERARDQTIDCRGEPPGHDPRTRTEHGHGHAKGHAQANGYSSTTAGTGCGYSSTRYRTVGRISQSTRSLVTVPSFAHPAAS